MENNIRSKQDLSKTLLYGKVPPHDKDIEEAILGAIMLEKNIYEAACEIIKAEHFYVDAHHKIFAAMGRLFKKRTPIDILTVVDELRANNELEIVGGPYAVTRLTNSVVSSAHIETHCKKVFEFSIKRDLAKVTGEILLQCYDWNIDSFELLNEADNGVRNILAGFDAIGRVKWTEVVTGLFSKFLNRVENEKAGIVDPNAVYTGIHDWDSYNGPLFRGGVYVVAGRPAMGKGVVMTQMAVNMAKKINVGVLNGEMTNDQFGIRTGCNMLGINNELWRKHGSAVTDEEKQLIHDSMMASYDLKLHMETTQDIDKAKITMYNWVKLHDVKVIMMDFLTMYKTRSTKRSLNRTEQAEYVMDVLVSTAKELNIPIIAFAQLNRESIAKGNVREPNLSDLKAAGEIEEKAYQVIALHRPEYYTNETADEMGESLRGLMYMICLKHRDGQTFRLKKRFMGASSQVEEWDEGFSPYTLIQPSLDNYRPPYKDDNDIDDGYNPDELF